MDHAANWLDHAANWLTALPGHFPGDNARASSLTDILKATYKVRVEL